LRVFAGKFVERLDLKGGWGKGENGRRSHICGSVADSSSDMMLTVPKFFDRPSILESCGSHEKVAGGGAVAQCTYIKGIRLGISYQLL
jgi:hypothetical protein